MAHCINVNSDQFKSILDLLNISLEVLELEINNYLNSNDTNDYPSIEYLKQQLLIGKAKLPIEDLDTFNKAHKLWENSYLNPSYFTSLLLALSFANEAIWSFGENNVRTVKTNDNRFVVYVGEPVYGSITDAPIEEINSTGDILVIDTNVELLENVAKQLVSMLGLDLQQLDNAKEEYGTKVVTDVLYPMDKLSIMRDNLRNSGISQSELLHLSKLAVNLFSYIVSHLLSSDEAKLDYLGDFPIDLVGKSRKEIISRVGINNLFFIVKDRFFNPLNSTIEDFELLDNLLVAYNNFEALILMSYSRLITLEEVALTGIDLTNIKLDELDYIVSENDSALLEEREREYWLQGLLNVSAHSSLSLLIKNAFEKLPSKDINGNIETDKYGFTVNIDSSQAINKVFEIVNKETTIEDMESKLKDNLTTYPWLSSILSAIQQEPFRSLFFKNFRKDFINYSVLLTDIDKLDNPIIKASIVNTKSSLNNLLGSILNNYLDNNVLDLFKVNKGAIDGKGTVNEEGVTIFKLLVELIKLATSNMFDNDRLSINLLKVSYNLLKVLNKSGIDIDKETVYRAIIKDPIKRRYLDTNTYKILTRLGDISDTLLRNKDNKEYILYSNTLLGVKSIYKLLANIFSKYMPDSIESFVYENGKSYYSYSNPNYINNLINKLKGATSNFNEYLSSLFAAYRWFKETPDLSDSTDWNNEWLRLLYLDKNLRDQLDIKILLGFDKIGYLDLSSLLYMRAILGEYFYDTNGKLAWYRIPIPSNKNRFLFIKFRRFTNDYKEYITDNLKKTFNLEILRTKLLLDRAVNPLIEKIANYDISDKFLNNNKNIKDKLLTGRLLDIKDFKVLTKERLPFFFLDYLNKDIIEDTELGKLIVDKINNKDVDVLLDKALTTAIRSNMDSIALQEIQKLKSAGLFESLLDSKTNKTTYKYLDFIGLDEDTITNKLNEFFWNDIFATINILLLTITDIAYYKNAEDLLKRYALLISPGLKPNKTAKDSNGIKVSKDGISRTIYIKDDIILSEIKENVKAALQEKENTINDINKKREFHSMSLLILSLFDKVNVADALAYSSPTSYRKKMIMLGSWDSVLELAYKRIREGNYDLNDLGIVWQPLKPFVYSQIEVPTGSDVMSTIKVGLLNKNSEYLLLLADAIIKGAGKVNRLSAIFNFMELSAYDNNNYNGVGIDTVLFESAVKVGKLGVIDINNAKSYEEILNILNTSTYNTDLENSNDRYNKLYVHEFDFEDYSILLEVPNHFKDSSLLMGSLMRILSITDITPGTEFNINGLKLTDKELINEYQTLIADNIKDSYLLLIDDFGLEAASIKEQNKKVSELLTDTILKDARYGIDLLEAVSLKEDGDFFIPLSDPILSDRILLLLNSIIKSRINKLKISGGPIVQASSYGLSNDLHIRFKDKEGNLLKLREEFNGTNEEYSLYIKDNQDSVAYFECYMPIPSLELEDLLTQEDSTIIDINSEKGKRLFPEELRRAIGYRI